MNAITVPRTPPNPSSRNGLAWTINKLPKPNEAQTIDQNDGGKVEIPKIMRQAAPDHLHHVGRTSDMNPKILLIKFMNNPFDPPDRFLRILVLEENDHVARLAIFRNQEASPKFAFQGVLKTFRPSGQTFDCADFVDRFKLLGEALDSTEVSRGGNILE